MVRLKVKAKYLILHNGEIYEPGMEFEVEEDVARPLLERGVAEVVEEKKEKKEKQK